MKRSEVEVKTLLYRLQNGWGAARRGPWWVRLPYASVSPLYEESRVLHLIIARFRRATLCPALTS